jgi:hypothetical protein
MGGEHNYKRFADGCYAVVVGSLRGPCGHDRPTALFRFRQSGLIASARSDGGGASSMFWECVFCRAQNYVGWRKCKACAQERQVGNPFFFFWASRTGNNVHNGLSKYKRGAERAESEASGSEDATCRHRSR